MIAEVDSIIRRYNLERQNEIIFYGASNFRMWTDMDTDLIEYKVQNHGFGGSTDKDLMEHAEKILFPYNPALVFFQIGSNDYVDLSGTDDEKVAACMAYKKNMFTTFHEKLPNAKFVVMSGLLLPGRSQYTALTQKINTELKKYCHSLDYMYFVDASDLTYDGTNFNTSLFISDMIHLNHTGQLRWCNEYIKPQIEALVTEYDLYWLSTENEPQPSAPTGLTGTAPSVKDGQDGKITGVSRDMEWKPVGEAGYTDCTGTEITDLTTGTYLVRFKSVNGKLPSEDVAVIVPDGTLERQIALANTALANLNVTNDTTAEDILAVVTGALTQGDIAVTWSKTAEIVKATQQTAGSIQGTLTFVWDDTAANMEINLTIPKLNSNILGDLDGDKQVDVSDVVKLRSIIISGMPAEQQIKAGDFDKDGKLTVTDVVALRSYIMKGTK